MIIADGADVRDLIPHNAAIRLIHIEESLTVGDKRNFGCERAAGQIIAHWDDDDFSAPERLADQVARLETSGLAVTGYRSMRFRDEATGQWWQYTGEMNYALGTSLCYRREWWAANRFLGLQVAEDNHFVYNAAAHQQVTSVDAGELMYATNHAGNTSPRNLGANWKQL